MGYYEEVAGFEEDGLIAHSAIQSIVHNVKVSATVVRGHLLCKGNDGKYSPVTENADASKALAIAATNFTPSETNSTTQAYARGVFNADKIYVGASEPYASLGHLEDVQTLIGEEIDFDTFQQSLRTQGIWITKMKE